MSGSDKILHDMEEGADDMTKYSKLFLQFLKKEVFQDRKSITVDEAVTLVAALMDLSVSLLSKFRNEPIDSTKATEIGRDAFMQMVDKLGFNNGQVRKSTIYT
jgi:thiazole synthase ThiGH ThiG subunit